MAHFRRRILADLLKKSLGWAPIVGIVGARQVGKTTLLRTFAKSYFTFDDPTIEMKFAESGQSLLEDSPGPLLLDEVQ